jgi:hypothetical protein
LHGARSVAIAAVQAGGQVDLGRLILAALVGALVIAHLVELDAVGRKEPGPEAELHGDEVPSEHQEAVEEGRVGRAEDRVHVLRVGIGRGVAAANGAVAGASAGAGGEPQAAVRDGVPNLDRVHVGAVVAGLREHKQPGTSAIMIA